MKKNLDDPFEGLDELSGTPALLKSEDMEQYRALEKEIERRLKPKNLFEALDARDIASAVWESWRFKEQAAGLVNVERPKALKKLTDPKSGYVPETEKAAKLIAAYRADPSAAGEANLLKKLGITNAAVDAHAVILAADNFLILDRLVANRNATRKAALKDYIRRQRLDAKRKRVTTKAKPKRKQADSDWD